MTLESRWAHSLGDALSRTIEGWDEEQCTLRSVHTHRCDEPLFLSPPQYMTVQFPLSPQSAPSNSKKINRSTNTSTGPNECKFVHRKRNFSLACPWGFHLLTVSKYWIAENCWLNMEVLTSNKQGITCALFDTYWRQIFREKLKHTFLPVVEQQVGKHSLQSAADKLLYPPMV